MYGRHDRRPAWRQRVPHVFYPGRLNKAGRIEAYGEEDEGMYHAYWCQLRGCSVVHIPAHTLVLESSVT